MANTYTLISSNVLSGTATSVTFSSIPQTYTDLVVRISAKTTTTNTADLIAANFNGSTSNFSGTQLYNSSGTVYTWAPGGYFGNVQGGAAANANIFCNGEIYIPNYTTSANKPFFVFNVNERNTTSGPFQEIDANLWQGAAAITSITFAQATGFATGSSFYLYGIKNS